MSNTEEHDGVCSGCRESGKVKCIGWSKAGRGDPVLLCKACRKPAEVIRIRSTLDVKPCDDKFFEAEIEAEVEAEAYAEREKEREAARALELERQKQQEQGKHKRGPRVGKTGKTGKTERKRERKARARAGK